MNTHVIGAIFRRNFLSYFSSPIGYLFICVFVVASSMAAFWPNEFFNNNLANLDQLNRWLPWILLVFIPAITMSIWAEERRQGTDELLLTIPASDFDVVLGKYLAAVAIYSVALSFSGLCNFAMLAWLGAPDIGLVIATYMGHWFVGIAMLAVGMVASFLSGNLTVAFVLGAVFNLPLIGLQYAGLIMSENAATVAGTWSYAGQFSDFGQGVISLSSVAYFTLIAAVMLYISMVLISRRHWASGRAGPDMRVHYAARIVAALAIVAGATFLFSNNPFSRARIDITQERTSSLSPATRELLATMKPKHPVKIEAFISPDVPENVVQTRMNLLNALREFKAASSGQIVVQIHETRPLSEEADRAEKLYGITARPVTSTSQGAMKQEDVFMGAAVVSGLRKVIIPYFEYGIPVEYELVRSVVTVADQDRKTLGVVSTEARLFGGFDPNSMSQTRNELIIDELEKQYDVKQVNPAEPIVGDYDVLLAVQPSSLGPAEMDNFINAVESGIPTAIFEDPFPYLNGGVTATSAPRQQQQNQMAMMMGGQQPPAPKGNIERLWNALGIDFPAQNVVWSQFNPYPRWPFPMEFVFVDSSDTRSVGEPFNEKNEISSRLRQLLFLFPGAVNKISGGGMKFEPLATSNQRSGYVPYSEILGNSMFGRGGGMNPNPTRVPTDQEYVIAARIQGELKDSKPQSDAQPEPDAAVPAKPEGAQQKPATDKGPDNAELPTAPVTPPTRKVDVVVVADIDLLFSDFFALRASAGDPTRGDFTLDLDNVTFVLNVLDSLAGDERFIDVRKHRPRHRTLTRIDDETEKAQNKAIKDRNDLERGFREEVDKARKNLETTLGKLEKRTDLDPKQMLQEMALAQQTGELRVAAAEERARKDMESKKKATDRELAQAVRGVRSRYKLLALILPPILPLLVGLGVFFHRRAEEREGVASSRLR